MGERGSSLLVLHVTGPGWWNIESFAQSRPPYSRRPPLGICVRPTEFTALLEARRPFKSHVSKQWRKQFEALPDQVKDQAQVVYEKWKQDPDAVDFSPMKTVGQTGVWKINIGRRYRTVGKQDGNTIMWLWIGSHESYNNIWQTIT